MSEITPEQRAEIEKRIKAELSKLSPAARAKIAARQMYARMTPEQRKAFDDSLVPNPLLTLHRHKACPCQSGDKFKDCCYPRLPTKVSAEYAFKCKIQMARPNLVFDLSLPDEGGTPNGIQEESKVTRIEEARRLKVAREV